MTDKKFHFIDLFAGCGGLSLGLENAGFFPILVNELSDEARTTYLINRAGIGFEHFASCGVDDARNPWVWKDVTSLNKYLLSHRLDFIEQVKSTHGIDITKGDLDLLVGGPPCQGFSGIGYRRSYSVEKQNIPSNHVYRSMISIINCLQPKMFLFENVRGLLSARWYQHKNSKRGEIWLSVRSEFKKILGKKYDIGWHLVHAYEYGVPQNRPRILMAGIRKDLGYPLKTSNLDEDGLLLYDSVFRAGGLLPNPCGNPPSLSDLLGDLIDENYQNGGKTTHYPKSAMTQIQKKLRTERNGNEFFDGGMVVSEQEYSRHHEEVIHKFRYMLESGGYIKAEFRTKKFAQRLLPKVWSNNQPTVTACSLPDDYVHFEQPRILTVREWARLQLFPDWYQFYGKRTTGGLRRAGNPREKIFEREVPKYTQIGNAVPVGLAEAVGKNFKKILNDCENQYD